MGSGMRLFLVRHGETDWNKNGIFRGTSDVPLNDVGRAQVASLGKALSDIPIRKIYSSHLSRALDTAKAIARGHRQERIITVDEGLSDIDRGEWAGLTHQQAKEKYPELYEKWFSAPQEVQFPGGNALSYIQDRSRAVIERIQREFNGDVVVVTHHVVIRALLCSLLDIPLSHFRGFEAFPASISQLEFEYSKWVLYRLNDVCHLAEIKKSEG